MANCPSGNVDLRAASVKGHESINIKRLHLLRNTNTLDEFHGDEIKRHLNVKKKKKRNMNPAGGAGERSQSGQNQKVSWKSKMNTRLKGQKYEDLSSEGHENLIYLSGRFKKKKKKQHLDVI